jgi:hypothetical protein
MMIELNIYCTQQAAHSLDLQKRIEDLQQKVLAAATAVAVAAEEHRRDENNSKSWMEVHEFA